MAASMLTRQSGCVTQTLTKNVFRRMSTNAYYVLLPEIPPDTPETNPIMRVHDYPEFKEITAETTVTGCAKLSVQYDVELGKHVENLKDPNFKKDFHSVFDPIEKLSVPLNYAWKTAKNLNYVKSTDGYRTAFQRIHPQVERARNERWISEPLYNAVKEVGAATDLDVSERRLVDTYLLECRTNGVELHGDEKRVFQEFVGKLVDAKNHYRNRVMLSHNLFSHTITDFKDVSDLPRSLVTKIAVDKAEPGRGPWKLNLNHGVYAPFMAHCRQRQLRWNMWQALNNRSSVEQDQQNLANHQIIKDIRMHRKDIAVLLGYENFAQMSMESKMAGSVENVMNMIDSLRNQFFDAAQQEVAELQDYATAGGFGYQLQMWDLAYWRRHQREQLYNIDMGQVSEYFALPQLLESMFEIVGSLFGIDIQDCTSEVDTWHDDVQFYKVFDSQSKQLLSAFYLDPYARPAQKLGGAWVESGRENSRLLSTTPFSYLNLNLTAPFGQRPCFMTMDEVEITFYEFGHALQQLLTTAPCSELAGQRGVPTDTLHMCALFMRMWLRQPAVLRRVSRHHESGDPLPDALISQLLDSNKHFQAYDMMKQLYYSTYDLEMYVSEDHWYTTMQRLWPEFVPMPLSDEDNHPCSLTAIFSDQYPAAFYSIKWSEMIAADAFKAFKEVENDPEKLAAVGKRFRDTFLSLGGSVPAGEIFRRFRGRDPDLGPLIEQCNTQP